MYTALVIIALVVNLIGFIWLVVVGFQRSILWGILIFLFSPITAIIFSIMYWYEAKKPFLIYLISSIVFVVGAVMMVSQSDAGKMLEIMQKIESGEIQPNEVYDYMEKKHPDLVPPDAMPPGMSDESLPADPAQVTDGEDKPADALPADAEAGKGETPDFDAQAKQTEQSSQPAEDKSRFPSPGSIKPDPLISKKQPKESPTVRVSMENIANYTGRYFIITTRDGNQHRGLLMKVTKTNLQLTRKLYGGNFEYRVARKNVKYADMLKKEYVKEFMER